MKFFSILFVTILIYGSFSSCKQKSSPLSREAPKSTSEAEQIQSEEEASLLDLGSHITLSLKKKDYLEFSKYIHPTKGVRMSPFAFIDVERDQVLQASDFSDIYQVKLWGHQDGTGDAIQMSIGEYLDKRVYNADYVWPEERGFNKFIGGGNSINNLMEVYPNHDFIEYHFSGIDPSLQGMDWCSLRLVFEKHQEQQYLVACIRDQWTI